MSSLIFYLLNFLIPYDCIKNELSLYIFHVIWKLLLLLFIIGLYYKTTSWLKLVFMLILCFLPFSIIFPNLYILIPDDYHKIFYDTFSCIYNELIKLSSTINYYMPNNIGKIFSEYFFCIYGNIYEVQADGICTVNNPSNYNPAILCMDDNSSSIKSRMHMGNFINSVEPAVSAGSVSDSSSSAVATSSTLVAASSSSAATPYSDSDLRPVRIDIIELEMWKYGDVLAHMNGNYVIYSNKLLEGAISPDLFTEHVKSVYEKSLGANFRAAVDPRDLVVIKIISTIDPFTTKVSSELKGLGNDQPLKKPNNNIGFKGLTGSRNSISQGLEAKALQDWSPIIQRTRLEPARLRDANIAASKFSTPFVTPSWEINSANASSSTSSANASSATNSANASSSTSSANPR